MSHSEPERGNRAERERFDTQPPMKTPHQIAAERAAKYFDHWHSDLTKVSLAAIIEVAIDEARASVERCEVCNSELSQCGVQGLDGEPSLDCLVCTLREQLAAFGNECEGMCGV